MSFPFSSLDLHPYIHTYRKDIRKKYGRKIDEAEEGIGIGIIAIN